MAEFTLRPKARSDLEEIWDYTFETWGVEQAERYLRLLDQGFRKVAGNPDLGRSCDAIREGYRKYGVGRHVIFFRLGDDGVEVVRILHERMDVDRHL
jgi:toxin ParE1/3/4